MICLEHLRRLCLSVSLFVFLQAEDGIRDLVRSRGRGDVYKRQAVNTAGESARDRAVRRVNDELERRSSGARVTLVPVSYTHLTLPTSDLV